VGVLIRGPTMRRMAATLLPRRKAVKAAVHSTIVAQAACQWTPVTFERGQEMKQDFQVIQTVTVTCKRDLL
jgi:hypothetical protein